MSRQSGYYWIMRSNLVAWEVAHFSKLSNSWYLLSSTRCVYHEDEIFKINETRILAPDEVSDDE